MSADEDGVWTEAPEPTDLEGRAGIASLEELQTRRRLLIERNLMGDLLEPGKTCLAFDESSGIESGLRQIEMCLALLKAPSCNSIGVNGRNRLTELMWSVERDGQSFRAWMERMFP